LIQSINNIIYCKSRGSSCASTNDDGDDNDDHGVDGGDDDDGDDNSTPLYIVLIRLYVSCFPGLG